MNKLQIKFCITVSMALLLPTLCDAGEYMPLRLPEPLSGLLSKVLVIKTEAMKLPGMRSENGKLGTQVEGFMEQIADLANEEIVKQAEEAQGHDIRAKMILWAQDRKNRPAEYERFAKLYLNRPSSHKDAIEYYYRPWKNAPHPFSDAPPPPESFLPRPGTWAPHPVDKEDVIEANRYVMEYCFFMPPTGRAFNVDSSRSNLSHAILSLLFYEKSYLIFENDFAIWFEIWKSNSLENHASNNSRSQRFTNQEGLSAIRSLPDHLSFRQFAKFASDAPVKEVIRENFRLYWRSSSIISGRDKEIATNYQKWAELAKKNWTKHEEREFSRLLLMIPPPHESTIYPAI